MKGVIVRNSGIIYLASIVLVPSLAIAGGGTPSVQIELGQNLAWNTPQLRIIAVENEVIIQSVKANRGNCKVTPHDKLPAKLSYGKILMVEVNQCGGKILEVEVSTNINTSTFKF